jgi:hypothetical protein
MHSLTLRRPRTDARAQQQARPALSPPYAQQDSPFYYRSVFLTEPLATPRNGGERVAPSGQVVLVATTECLRAALSIQTARSRSYPNACNCAGDLRAGHANAPSGASAPRNFRRVLPAVRFLQSRACGVCKKPPLPVTPLATNRNTNRSSGTTLVTPATKRHAHLPNIHQCRAGAHKCATRDTAPQIGRNHETTHTLTRHDCTHLRSPINESLSSVRHSFQGGHVRGSRRYF